MKRKSSGTSMSDAERLHPSFPVEIPNDMQSSGNPVERVHQVLNQSPSASPKRNRTSSVPLDQNQLKMIRVLKELCRMRLQKGFSDTPSVFPVHQPRTDSTLSKAEQSIWLDEYAKAIALCREAMKANFPHPYQLVTRVLNHNLNLRKRKRIEEGNDRESLEKDSDQGKEAPTSTGRESPAGKRQKRTSLNAIDQATSSVGNEGYHRSESPARSSAVSVRGPLVVSGRKRRAEEAPPRGRQNEKEEEEGGGETETSDKAMAALMVKRRRVAGQDNRKGQCEEEGRKRKSRGDWVDNYSDSEREMLIQKQRRKKKKRREGTDIVTTLQEVESKAKGETLRDTQRDGKGNGSPLGRRTDSRRRRDDRLIKSS